MEISRALSTEAGGEIGSFVGLSSSAGSIEREQLGQFFHRAEYRP